MYKLLGKVRDDPNYKIYDYLIPFRLSQTPRSFLCH
jgi:hypothetical protein